MFLRYRVRHTEFFVVLSHFLTFYPLTTEKNQNFKKMKKVSGYVIILHVYQKSQSYDVCFLRSGEQWTEFFVILDFLVEPDRHNFLSFWTTFCPFTNNPRNQNFQKIKKYQEILSLYKCVP